MSTKDLDQASDYLKVSADTMRELADAGTIPGAKVGKRWVFRVCDLDAYLADVIARQTEERRSAPLKGVRQRVKTEVSEVREKRGNRRVPPVLPELQDAA